MDDQDDRAGRNPAPRRRRRFLLDSRATRLFLAAAIVILVTVASVPVTNAVVYSPTRTVQAYLSALSAGNAPRALGLLAAPEAERGEALTGDVLDAAPALPTRTRIVDARVDDDAAHVTASYTLGDETRETEFTLVRGRPHLGLFRSWLIEFEEWPALALDVTGSADVEINGVTAPADEGAVPVLFPVAYDVGFDAQYLRSDISQVSVSAPGEIAEVALSPEPTDQLREEVQRQLDAHLDECVQATTLLPAGCTFGYTTNNQILGDVRWEVVSYPAVTLTSRGAELTVRGAEAVLRVSGRYRDIVTAYETDFSEEITIRISSDVRVEGGEVRIDPRDGDRELG